MIDWDKSGYNERRFSEQPKIEGKDKFQTFDEIKEISDGIFSYKNFMGKSFHDFITSVCNEISEESYATDHYEYEVGDILPGIGVAGKLLTPVTKHIDAFELLLSLRQMFSPRYSMLFYTEFLRLKTGENFQALELNLGPKYKIAYFCGDFTGGEINFYDKNIQYQIEPDELIIFDALYLTSVKDVLSGTRYCYVNYVYEDPGVVMI
jgi:hypothetical protein